MSDNLKLIPAQQIIDVYKTTIDKTTELYQSFSELDGLVGFMQSVALPDKQREDVQKYLDSVIYTVECFAVQLKKRKEMYYNKKEMN